jgi:hypothetical protein
VAPVTTLLWILGAVFLLNVLIAGWLVTLELVERRRLDKEIKEVDTLWRSLTMPETESAGWGSPLGIGVKQRTPVLHRLPAPPRSVGKASVSLAVAASALWVVVAAFGAEEPGPVVSALESPVLQAEERERLNTDTSSAPGAKGISGTTDSTQGSSDATSSDAIATSGVEAAPAAVAADPQSSTAIYLHWAGVPDATGYEVERKKEETRQGWLTIATVEESVTAFTDGDLDSGTTYFYRVSAMTGSGAALASDVVSATTPAGTVPAATSATAVAALDTITLAWVDVSDETGYRIELSRDGLTDWVEIGTTGQGVTVYTDSSLSPGATYYYRIVATNAAGDSAPSNVVDATTETNKVAEPPADGSATPSNGAPAGEVPSSGPSGGALAEDVLVTEESVVLEPTP